MDLKFDYPRICERIRENFDVTDALPKEIFQDCLDHSLRQSEDQEFLQKYQALQDDYVTQVVIYRDLKNHFVDAFSRTLEKDLPPDLRVIVKESFADHDSGLDTLRDSFSSSFAISPIGIGLIRGPILSGDLIVAYIGNRALYDGVVVNPNKREMISAAKRYLHLYYRFMDVPEHNIARFMGDLLKQLSS